MKIVDLEHFTVCDRPKQITGGLPAELPPGLFIAFGEDGGVTLFENGEELYSYMPQDPGTGFSFYFEGVSAIGTRCETVDGNSRCEVSIQPDVQFPELIFNRSLRQLLLF